MTMTTAMDSSAAEAAPEAMHVDVDPTVTVTVGDDLLDDEEDVSALEAQLEAATALEASPAKVSSLLAIATESNDEYSSSAAGILRERAVYLLTRTYCALQDYDAVVHFVTHQDEKGSYWPGLTKAKSAKVVRQILSICTEPESNAPLEKQESLARAVEAWTISENRTFLRHRVQSQLAEILFQQGDLAPSLALVEQLTSELKKLDDKSLLVEIHLLEAKLQLELANVPKAKASLTASRTAAHAIYVAPALQADLDSVSGNIHVQEKDYHTAHSYFLEAFEQLDQMNSTEQAQQALLYMLLCQVLGALRKMLDGTIKVAGTNGSGSDSKDASALIVLTGKHIKYAGRPVDAIQAIGRAAQNRDLRQFEEVWQEYSDVLQQDSLVNRNLQILQTQLLESNLLRVLEPYSHVQLEHVAKLVHLPVEQVERKLSQMILDGTFKGILDQGAGHVVVYEDIEGDGETSAHATGLEILSNVDDVVTSLFSRSQALRTMMI